VQASSVSREAQKGRRMAGSGSATASSEFQLILCVYVSVCVDMSIEVANKTAPLSLS